jgi:predicted extracellular nuclease
MKTKHRSTGAVVLAFAASILSTSPAGVRAATPVTIPEIQGVGQRSPYEGQEVETTGVVTAVSLDGRSFWI